MLGRGFADAVHGSVPGMGFMFLDTCEQIERGAWAGGVPLGLQAHAHDAVEHEGKEADQGMCPDAIRQTVMDRCDLNIGFQYAEAAFNVSESFVAGDGLCRGDIRSIGQEGKFAVEEFRRSNGILIECPGEPVGGIISFDEACEFGLCDRPSEATVSPAV